MKSDRQLQKDVIDELSWDPAVDSTAVGVEVKDGVVTLSGHVSSYAQKWAAEEATLRVAGVKGIAIEIDIALAHSHKRSDVDLINAAAQALDWSVSVPAGAIKLTAQHGWLTLTGTVDWAFQRAAALSAMRDLVGVVGINDHIKIAATPTSQDVKVKIEAALQRRAHADTRNISVEIVDDNVTLNGFVDSWAEKNAARMAAWAAPGVNNVIDNLRLSA